MLDLSSHHLEWYFLYNFINMLIYFFIVSSLDLKGLIWEYPLQMVDLTKDKHNLHFWTDTTDKLCSAIKELGRRDSLKAFEDTKSINNFANFKQ